jgi:hypothetical protein
MTPHIFLQFVLAVYFPTAPAREAIAHVEDLHVGKELAELLFGLLKTVELRWPYGRACHFKCPLRENVSPKAVKRPLPQDSESEQRGVPFFGEKGIDVWRLWEPRTWRTG